MRGVRRRCGTRQRSRPSRGAKAPRCVTRSPQTNVERRHTRATAGCGSRATTPRHKPRTDLPDEHVEHARPEEQRARCEQEKHHHREKPAEHLQERDERHQLEREHARVSHRIEHGVNEEQRVERGHLADVRRARDGGIRAREHGRAAAHPSHRARARPRARACGPPGCLVLLHTSGSAHQARPKAAVGLLQRRWLGRG